MSSLHLSDCDILVLAGGLGTRLRDTLGSVPKILAPIQGRPYIDILISWLMRSGARRIVFSLGHRAEAIIDYLNTQNFAELKIDYAVEPAPLGTAGAVRFARHMLRSNPIIVMNGDSIVECDFSQFLLSFMDDKVPGSILAATVANAGRFGRLETDEQRILGFVEKDPTFSGSAEINAGVYILSKAFLDDLCESNATSLEKDVFAKAPSGTFGVFRTSGRFLDIGTPEALAFANSPAFLALSNSKLTDK